MRPLLVVDGDSFAHRAYHALPEVDARAWTAGRRTRSSGSRTCCCACGGTSGRARCSWRGTRSTSRRTGTRRSTAYQSGRVFDDELLEQLDLLPALVASTGFACAKTAGYEADDFLAAAATQEEAAGGEALVATSDRDAFQLVTERVTVLQPAARRAGADRPGPGARALRRRSGAGAGLHRAPRRSVGQDPRRAWDR